MPSLNMTGNDSSASSSSKPVVHSDMASYAKSFQLTLSRSINCETALRGEPLFAESVAIFNDAVQSQAWLVVLPTSVNDISTTVGLCYRHGLQLSVKSGGFATAGWSTQGDVVIDTKRMDDILLRIPKQNASDATAIPKSSTRSAAAGINPSSDHGMLHTDHMAVGPELEAHTSESSISIHTHSASVIDSVAKQQLSAQASGFVESKTAQHADGSNRAFSSKRARIQDSEDVSSSDDYSHSQLRRRANDQADKACSKIASSNESGADADSESSYASSEHNPDQPISSESVHRSDAASSRQDYLSASEPRETSENFGIASETDRRTKKWTNRQMERAANASNSSSSGSGSGSTGGSFSSNKASSSTSASKTSASPAKSPSDETNKSQLSSLPATANSADGTGERSNSSSSHLTSTSSRAGEPITLPEGSFTWTSDGVRADVTSSLSNPSWSAQVGSTEQHDAHSAFGNASSTSRGLAATTLADLQDAWPVGTWAVNSDALTDQSSSAPRFISSTGPFASPLGDRAPMSSEQGFQQSPTSNPILPAGMYKDRYALATFGPGAGIRALDAFTDRAGRDANILAHDEHDAKGKAKDKLPMPLVVNGVPYYIPGSAYPVGSTSMTVGGFGYLTRAYGLSLDNIVEVQMVLADGRIVTLNEESKNKTQEERDLWWAVRGAAPCFGIVSRLTVKAYPVPSVYSGNLIYPLNPATASSLIRHWRDCLKSGLPRTFYSNLILTAGPSKTSHVIVIQICFLGSKSEGEPLVQMISSWSGERLLLKDVEERSFLSQQDGVAKVLKGGLGRRWMVRGDLISTLTDEVISQSVRKFQGLGSRAVWLFELLGGAIEDAEADDTCIGADARSAKFIVGSLQQWSGEADDKPCIENVDRWLSDVVGKVSIGGPFPCFLSRDEPMNRVMGSFGLSNFGRLLQIKKRVDPSNVFRHTFGDGLGVKNPDRLLAELEMMDAQRKALQQSGTASVSNSQNSSV